LKELIIDITYNCDSHCKYCQWNTKNNRKSKNPVPLENILVSRSNLTALNISRIVLSGGEPLLAPHLNRVLNHYNKASLNLRLMTNGFNLSSNVYDSLINYGVKEYTFSIDALLYETYSKNRGNSREYYKTVKKNLMLGIKKRKQMEIEFISLNVVLTNVNCNWENIEQLLRFAKKHQIDQIKFQPVFDDGYLSNNSPNLTLKSTNIRDIKKIIKNIRNRKYKPSFTNPIGFWEDLILLLKNKELNSERCAVVKNSILLHEGVLKYCFWCENSHYGPISKSFTKNYIKNSNNRFRVNLNKCQVKPQCFCLQPINHVWSKQ
jgi:molybdenum cofactor biosynthesis enzyme MoaA